MYDWGNQDYKLECRTYSSVKSEDGPEEITSIYEIDGLIIKIPGEVPEIKWSRNKNYHGKDVDKTFPSAKVENGTLSIGVEDFVELILSRLEPADLAEQLWQNDEVKEHFMECLATRYSEMGIDDKDRRNFLHKVKEAVHSKALDAKFEAIAAKEYDQAQRFHVWDIEQRINSFLERDDLKEIRQVWSEELKGYMYKEEPLRISLHSRYGEDFGVAGKNWEEARNFWRQQVLTSFPPPEAPPKEEKDYIFP